MESWTEILEAFSRCPEVLTQALDQTPDLDIDLQPDDGGWSTRQIVHHLADASLIWGMFLRQALGDSGGEFPLQWYWARSQDEWGQSWAYSARELRSSLDLYQSSTESMLSLLKAAEDPRKLSLKLNFPDQETQEISVEGAVRWQVTHLESHLDQIRALHRQAEN